MIFPEKKDFKQIFILFYVRITKVIWVVNNMIWFVPKNINKFKTRDHMLKYYCEQISNPKLLEIGVFKGDFLHYIFTSCSFGSIDAVDLFEGVTYSGDVNGNNIVNCDIGKSYVELTNKYIKEEKIKLFKSDSTAFLKNQKDNKYDIIYIDADHSSQGVKQDLINAYDKIKDEGYIMGHDYAINLKKAKNIHISGVKKGVNEFCKKYNQNISAFAFDGYISFCIKIDKSKFTL